MGLGGLNFMALDVLIGGTNLDANLQVKVATNTDPAKAGSWTLFLFPIGHFLAAATSLLTNSPKSFAFHLSTTLAVAAWNAVLSAWLTTTLGLALYAASSLPYRGSAEPRYASDSFWT